MRLKTVKKAEKNVGLKKCTEIFAILYKRKFLLQQSMCEVLVINYLQKQGSPFTWIFAKCGDVSVWSKKK